MGARGPHSAPTALKLLRGEDHRDRLNLAAPKPRDEAPVRPATMSVAAKRVWARIEPEVRAMGVVKSADGDVLRLYCECVVRYVRAARKLEREGPTVPGARDRETVRNPLHPIVRDEALLMVRLARELGLTPSGRESLHANPGDPADSLDKWVEGDT